MSLSATIAYGGTTYELKCEVIEHSILRMPVQAGLPTTQGTEGSVLTVDLGVAVQQISLNGLIDVTSPGGNIPSRNQLVVACLTWWQYGATASVLPVLAIPGTSYYVALKNASFRMEGALEDRWYFSLTYLVREEQ